MKGYRNLIFILFLLPFFSFTALEARSYTLLSTIDASVNLSAGGTITPSGTITTLEGSNVSFAITAEADYYLKALYIDGTYIGGPIYYTFTRITSGHHTIKAYFDELSQPNTCKLTPLTATSVEVQWRLGQASSWDAHVEKSLDGIYYTEVGTTAASSLTVWYRGNGTTNLNPNTKYWFRVRSGFNGIYTDYVTAEPKYTLAEVPSTATYEGITSTSVKVTWEAGNNPAGTEYFCSNNSSLEEINSGWITGTNWTCSTLEAGQTYNFYITARNFDDISSEAKYLGNMSTKTSIKPITNTGGSSIASGDVISCNPKIVISSMATTGVSASGIAASSLTSFDPTTFRLYIDGILATDGLNIYYDSFSQANIISSSTSTIATFEYSPKTALSVGTHTIEVSFSDSNGILYRNNYGNLKVMQSGGMIGSVLCYPNPYDPFAGNLRIAYSLAVDADTTVYIFDSTGALEWKNSYTRGLMGGAAGYNEATWDGRNIFGTTVVNGVYIARIISRGAEIGKAKIGVVKSR